MKVTITFVVDVDADGWAAEFGVPRTPVAIRRHVLEYARELVRAELAELDLLAE